VRVSTAFNRLLQIPRGMGHRCPYRWARRRSHPAPTRPAADLPMRESKLLTESRGGETPPPHDQQGRPRRGATTRASISSALTPCRSRLRPRTDGLEPLAA